MNPEVKEKWLEALRSGKYKQGRNVLCSVNENGDRTYCCLGVLSEIAVQEGFAQSVVEDNAIRYDCELKNGSDLGEKFTLTRRLADWAGLERINPPININGEVNEDGDVLCYTMSLAELNDAGRSFNEIAQLIEDQL